MLTLQKINEYKKITDKYNFTNDGLAMFLAQNDHESMGFTRLSENLNYSADRLLVIFKKYFNESNVYTYARQPEKIANRVYANRMGNGDEASGDGFKYRGRGYLQLTGKDNYNRCGKSLELDLVNNPDLLLQPEYAMMSAIWFFQTNNIINNTDVESVTKRVNGGTHGLAERQRLFEAYKKLLA